MVPDWQLPPGVDRGLWVYLHAADMVAGYDEQMRASPLARADVAFCDSAFSAPGRLVDLGCGTGRLCHYFAAKGFECVGVDLSEEMLARTRAGEPNPPAPFPEGMGEPDLPSPLAGEGSERSERVRGDAQRMKQPYPSPGGEAPPPSPARGEGKSGSPSLQGGGWGVGSVSLLKANLVDLSEVPERSFDYAACLFSTLGMVRGVDNRAKVVANAFRLLKPGGRFVLHVHNRFFRALGWKRVVGQRLKTLLRTASAGDIAMPQAYGGAPLTLHHFTRREVVAMLEIAGFGVTEVRPIGLDGELARGSRVYGWLVLASRPV